MESVVLIIHLFLALAIVGLVLLQRSEGGGLGIGGGGGGMGSLASAQSTANILTRATAICTACFFATSLLLGILAGTHSQQTSIMDRLDEAPTISVPADSEEPVIEDDLDLSQAKKKAAEDAKDNGQDTAKDESPSMDAPSAPVAE